MSRWVMVCDGCGAVLPEPRYRDASPEMIRGRATDQGWLCTDAAGRDLCPACRPEGATPWKSPHAP